MYDVIIVGGGPAGLCSAVYGKRAGLNVLVIERNMMSGGQVLNTYEVDNYLGLPDMNGFELGMRFKEHAQKTGAEFVRGTVKNIEDHSDYKVIETAEGNRYETKTLILAMGAEHAKLSAEGEETLKGRGVSYCATCDGAFFKGRNVAVVGGGDVAVEDAIYLSRMCNKVYVVHRRDSFRAAKSLQQRLLQCENVEVCWNKTVTAIRGQDVVEEIELQSVTESTKNILAVNGVFIAVGMQPETDLVRKMVTCDEKGYIVAGEDCLTSVPGIFVAGDIRTKNVRQIITAVADGACAIASVEKYLNTNS